MTALVEGLKLVKYDIPESAKIYKPNAPFAAKVVALPWGR